MEIAVKDIRLAVAACALLAVLAPGQQGLEGADLLSPEAAARVGMVESWRRQLSLIGGAQSAVDIKFRIDGKHERHYVEISRQHEGVTEVLNRRDVNQLDRFGQPLGLDEAMRLSRLEAMRWKRRKVETEISERKVRQMRIYTVGRDGTIEVRDGETGELIWVTRQGNPDLFSGGVGANDDFVAFVNGTIVYQIDAANGRFIRKTPMRGTPLAGCVIADRHALVPTTHNGVEGFPLYENDELPFLEIVPGRISTKPVRGLGRAYTAFATESRYFYVIETEGEPSAMFRLQTDGVVSSDIAVADLNRFICASESGQVYAIQATRSGKLLWRQSLGQPVYSGVFVSGERVFVSTAYKNLFCLELGSGELAWRGPVAQIDRVLAVADGHVFVRTNSNRLAVLDIESGARVADLKELVIETVVPNRLSDRLYLIGRGGMMQCLRPISSPLPKYDIAGDPRQIDEDSADGTDPYSAPAPADKSTQPQAPDPFGGQAAPDPFGAGDSDPFAPAGDMADPFGGDPFGGDPFGG